MTVPNAGQQRTSTSDSVLLPSGLSSFSNRGTLQDTRRSIHRGNLKTKSTLLARNPQRRRRDRRRKKRRRRKKKEVVEELELEEEELAGLPRGLFRPLGGNVFPGEVHPFEGTVSFLASCSGNRVHSFKGTSARGRFFLYSSIKLDSSFCQRSRFAVLAFAPSP